MSQERTGHSLQTTALVNEAYLRLVDCKRMRWQDRAHFFALNQHWDKIQTELLSVIAPAGHA